MINRFLGKITVFTLVLSLLTGQSFGQIAPSRKNFIKNLDIESINIPVAVQDNTRVVNHRLNEALAKQVSSSVTAQLIVDHNDYSSSGIDRFDKLANDAIAELLATVTTSFNPAKDLSDIIFFAALPKLYMHAVFKDASNYSKISNIYVKVYEDCISNKPTCDYERGGYAAMFLAAAEIYNIKLSDIAALAKNPEISDENKIVFLQSAAAVLSQKGGRLHFEDIIKTVNKNTEIKTKVQGGYIDPFILVKIVDGGYEWVKEACSHKDGFWQGACAKVSSDKAFKEYMYSPRPSYGDREISGTGNIIAINSARYKAPSLLAASLRLYGEFYSDEYSWEETFKFLYNLPTYEDYVVSSHLNITLAKLLLKAPQNLPEKQKLTTYIAAKLNNNYFALNMVEDIDPALRASLQNELGSSYAALKGYKGQSPLTYTTDEGFVVQINFKDNEKQIEGFAASLFNFKDRPAEALTNIFIIGAITKGIAKNGDKIMAAAGKALSAGSKTVTNMPAIIAKARAQYKALQYLSSKNGMSFAKYAYRNNQYRAAAQTASKANIITVEGRATGEFFKSSAYNPSVHGNIGRIAADVKQAAKTGVQHLGVGGSVPSYVDQATFSKGVKPFAADYAQQQKLQVSIANKYKTTALEASKVAAQPVAQPMTSAPYSLPRKVLYSQPARFLPLAQNQTFAQDYLFRNDIFAGLRQRGFKFFDTKTGSLFGPKLNFHHEGYLQAQGRIGLSYESIGAPAAASASSPLAAMQAALQPSAKADLAIRKTVDFAAKSVLPKAQSFYGSYQLATLAALTRVPVVKPLPSGNVMHHPYLDTDAFLSQIYAQSGRRYLQNFADNFAPKNQNGTFFDLNLFKERLAKLEELTPYISPIEWNINNHNGLLWMVKSPKPSRWEMFDHYYNAIMADLPPKGKIYALNTKLSGDWLHAMKNGPRYVSTGQSTAEVQDMMIESEIRSSFNVIKPYSAIEQHLFPFQYAKERVSALLGSITDAKQFEDTGKMLLSYVEEIKDLGRGNMAVLNGPVHWETIEEITPQTIAISHEVDDITIGQVISQWIQKSNIPYSGTDVVQFMPDFIEARLGLTPEKPGILIKFEDTLMLYNNDYTARVRFGNHEIEGSHIHFEFKNKVPAVSGHATRTNFAYKWPQKYTDFAKAKKEMFYNYVSVLDAKGLIADQTGTLTGQVQPFMKEFETLQGLSPSEYAHSTFKVMRKDGNSGSGFYVNYHGIPLVLTASHVVLSDPRPEVQDFVGNTVSGRVIHKMMGNGYDIAAIAVDYDFLKGRQPFALAKKEPVAGSVLMQHSYPIFNRFRTLFRTDIVEFLNPSFTSQYLRNTMYLTTRSDIDGGSSGGPLTHGFIRDEVVGITHALTPDGREAIFMPLPRIKKFLGELSKKLLFEDFFRQNFLPKFPAFSARYPNIINRLETSPASVPLYTKYLENSADIKKIMQDVSTQGADNIIALSTSGQVPQEIESSIVKIRRAGNDIESNSSGTGFYINYRGLPMLLTASHVVGDKKFVELYDSDGIFGTGEVFATTGNSLGYDLAIVLPNKGFLEGKTPLKLSLKEGVAGEQMYTLGYPGKNWLTNTPLTLTNEPTVKDMQTALETAGDVDIYTVLPGIFGGNSGGPLIKQDNTVIGVAHKGGFSDTKRQKPIEAYFITLPNVRKFLKQTLKMKFLNQNFNQRAFFKEYPLLKKNYENVIERYREKMGSMKFVNYPVLYDNDFFVKGSIVNFGPKVGNASYNEGDGLYFSSQEAYNQNFNRIKAGVFAVENSILGRTGTGFYVKSGQDGALVTAAHMIRNASTVLVRPATGERLFSASVAGSGKGNANDIAILEVQDNDFWKYMQPLTPSLEDLAKGDEIISYGFPWGGLFEDRIGKVTGFDVFPEGRMIKATEHTAPGSSGGPVLFRNKIIGMCSSGVCTEDLPYMIQKIQPFSAHTPWENIERFLDIMKLWTIPQQFILGVDINNPFAVSTFLKNLKRPVVLDPKGYNIKNKQPVIFINPYEQFTEFNFSE